MEHNRKQRRTLGFTLVEMLLVMTIIGVLATIVVMNFTGLAGESKVNATRASIQTISMAMQTYEFRTGSYPKSIEELTVPIGNTPAPLPKGMVDAWGTPFTVKALDQSYEIRSAGPDREMGNADDITN